MADAQHSRVLVVLVNYNGRLDTMACISSLSASHEPLQVLVVDNGSNDGSVGIIRAAHPDVCIVEAGRNLGFAAACNVGLRSAQDAGVEYVWLLNNDTLVEPEAAGALIAAAVANHDAAFVGCWITYEPDRTRLWFAGGTFDRRTGAASTPGEGHLVISRDTNPRVQPVDWVTGCSILIPVQKLVEIGVLDEAYFLYGEELEWQLRARRLADARSYVVASPLVHHRVGATTGSTRSTLGTTFMARNQLKLLRTQSGGFWPFWLLHWARAYLVRPLKLRRPALVLAALRGLCNMRTSGADIVERYGRFTDPSPVAICHDLRT